jgi:hypothetical protein
MTFTVSTAALPGSRAASAGRAHFFLVEAGK